MCGSLNIIWHCPSLGLEFSSLVATAEFPKLADILSAALSQYHLLGFEIVPGVSMGNPTHGKGHEERSLTKRKGGIRPQGSLWIFSSIYYRNQSLPALLCYAFHLLV